MIQRPAFLVPVLAVLAILVASAPASAAAPAPDPGAGSLAQRSNVPGLTAAQYANAFVTRRGSRLYVAGRRLRLAGANGESLGLRNYGPILSAGQRPDSERYPTRFEIDDELATLHEMGATVVRAQTIGDTVGCALCLEPALGRFNPRAFAELDLAVLEAHRYGIKLIGEFAGDANGTEAYGPPTPGAVVGNASTDWYCAWRHVSQKACLTATFEDPRLLADYERHMRAVLDHVNRYTGIAYKDDPTFAGWVDGNNLWLLNPTPLPAFERWLAHVAADFKSLDHRQLFIDISAAGADYLPPSDTFGLSPNLGRAPVAALLRIRGVDLYGQEWYPKDFPALDPHSPAATQIHVNAAAIAAAGKAYATIEFGWDHFNAAAPSVYRMAGFARVPAHERPPAPVITATQGGRVRFAGSAGAAHYSVQKRLGGRWVTRCRGCRTDNTDGWQDPARRPGCYRVIPINRDGRRGVASRPAGRCVVPRPARLSASARARAVPAWVGSWSSPPVRPGILAATVALDAGTGGHTVRNVVHLTLGGSAVRVRLSNVFGSRPATFTDVRIALRRSGASVVASTSRRLRFSGATSVTIGVGRERSSDPVVMTVRAGEDLAISLYAPRPTGMVTTAGSLNHTNYLSGTGDHTAAGGASSFPATSQAWYWLDGVDVRPHSPDAGAIVALGDSITAGYNSTLDANRDWVDLLGVRLRTAHTRPPLAVLNAGIAGNNLHEDTRCFGQSALTRMDRDVFAQPGRARRHP